MTSSSLEASGPAEGRGQLGGDKSFVLLAPRTAPQTGYWKVSETKPVMQCAQKKLSQSN